MYVWCVLLYRELLRSMGEAGEIEPETESFLIENDIEFGEFPPEALDCLPKQTPWTIPQVFTLHMTLVVLKKANLKAKQFNSPEEVLHVHVVHSYVQYLYRVKVGAFFW